MYTIERVFGKYIIHKTGDNTGKFGLYLQSVKRNGDYIWSYDYTYAKTMTLKTATKHFNILSQEG